MQGLLGRTSKKRGSQRFHEKRIQGFHTTWAVIQTLVARDAVETVDKVAMAEEVKPEVPVQLLLGRCQRLVPSRIWRGTFFPSAWETRTRMATCFAHPWRRWQRTLALNMAMKLLKNWPAGRRSISKSLPTPKPYWIGMRQGSRQPESKLSWGSRVWELRRAIEAKIIQAPTNRRLLKELWDIDNQITRGDIKLNDEVEMKLADNEKLAHSNAWRTHREMTESPKEIRGKVYSLLLGQCTWVGGVAC